MKVLICGGRDYSNYQDLKAVLDKFFITEIISGGARGADSLAIQYAKARRIPYREYPADWKKARTQSWCAEKSGNARLRESQTSYSFFRW